MAKSGFRWVRGPEAMIGALDDYEKKILAAVQQVAKYFEPILENYAKNSAPWQDRTGNARQSLFSVSELAEDVVKLYLSHGVEYGLWLEVLHEGRYAVILPTLQAHYNQIMAMLKGIFG